MTYYGRWTYKYEIASEKGAAAAIIVHETGPAGYPIAALASWRQENFGIQTPDRNMSRVAVESWITVDKAKQFFTAAGQDFEALKKAALSKDFKPVPLNAKANFTIKTALREVASTNVIAKLEGSNEKLKDEYLIYTAHWDHMGRDPKLQGDQIFNGAHDNASGAAGLLELAEAFAKLNPAPKRSILFLAVTAEEQGLLGSEYYATQPLYPLATTLADINMDALNVTGRTTDLTIVGLGASELDTYAWAAAKEQGRTLKADAEPEKGFYYRSDHFNFAKVGVPALTVDEGVDYVGKPAAFSAQVRSKWTADVYHKPSDEVTADWDLSGLAEDVQLLFAVGYRVAEADRYPAWSPGNEFKAIRDAQLKTGK
jgi:Zn-dependent M28 family amino/carboxypeptidase